MKLYSEPKLKVGSSCNRANTTGDGSYGRDNYKQSYMLTSIMAWSASLSVACLVESAAVSAAILAWSASLSVACLVESAALSAAILACFLCCLASAASCPQAPDYTADDSTV